IHALAQRGGHNLTLAGKDQVAMTLPLRLNVAQQTDIGRTRATNEDQLLSFVPNDEQLLQDKGALFVVSDGLGGHQRGDVASELTVQKVREFYYQNLQD